MSDNISNGKKSSSGTGRTRNWLVIVYPDSAPDNWRDIINDFQIEWIESPLHDKDLNETGEPKKAHWHILLMFGSVKSFEQVKAITDLLNTVIPKPAHNSRSSVRYMAHLDNPEKAQYSISDIISHGGADIAEMIKASSSERYSLIAEMIDFIEDDAITEFKDLVNFARINRFDDWFPLLCDNSTYVLNCYIKSQRYSKEKDKK